MRENREAFQNKEELSKMNKFNFMEKLYTALFAPDFATDC